MKSICGRLYGVVLVLLAIAVLYFLWTVHQMADQMAGQMAGDGVTETKTAVGIEFLYLGSIGILLGIGGIIAWGGIFWIFATPAKEELANLRRDFAVLNGNGGCDFCVIARKIHAVRSAAKTAYRMELDECAARLCEQSKSRFVRRRIGRVTEEVAFRLYNWSNVSPTDVLLPYESLNRAIVKRITMAE